MLDRVAVHQTRLRVPGIGLDARGVALGARGLVLLPSLDRLIAFLAVYTEDQALGGLLESLSIDVVKSKLGAREIALSFDAGSSDRMDRVSEVARLTGGFTFTGTSRHFVQYRDAAAPFGYDAREITATDAPLALYHNTFNQVYEVERQLDLKSLLMRLMPHADPTAELEDGPLWILAESGLGPSLLGYFARSQVGAEVGIAEWPPETSFDEGPTRRFLFRVQELPPRMRTLVRLTPGITAFIPAGPYAAVEHAFRHPITLSACPVFERDSLVLFRGRGEPALEIRPLPVLADVRALQSAELGSAPMPAPAAGADQPPPPIAVPVRLMADLEPPSALGAIFVPADELSLLRRLVYALSVETIKRLKIAVAREGAFVVSDGTLEAIPLGIFYQRLHPSIFAPVGLRVVPAVDPDTLFRSLGAPEGVVIFLRQNAPALAVQSKSFAPLEHALLEGHSWAPVDAAEIEPALATEIPTVWLDPLGMRPLADVESAAVADTE
jgi:hypothetical protein